MICPKCQYQRRPDDSAHAGVCPACGIAYVKWGRPPPVAAPAAEPSETAEALFVPVESFRQRAHHYLCFMPSDGHIAAFWAHVAVYISCLLWGWSFIVHGIDWLWVGKSFLHAVNLPFHEFGHILFMPWGTFWMLLGGSLFQILAPLLPLFYFMVWQRDNFAAAMMLWWCGQNFIDVAPYIADAPLRALPLISGDYSRHDWWNLLSLSGALGSAQFYAELCFALGVAVILLSNVWGAYLLSIEFRGRTRPRASATGLQS